MPLGAAEPSRIISAAAFARAMKALGPFEPAPHLAVAVSGGGDSMALALLAARWATARGGRVTALTVDHRLRPESGAEARRVRAWLARRGIAHRILAWEDGPRAPRAGLQARARAARYALLEDWCARAGILHLLTAHHLDDQAETFLLRLGQRSGVAGLAAMGRIREGRQARLLRPLLGFPRTRLEAHLRALGQEWISDPSNADPAFARARLRALLPALAADGLDTAALGRLAARFGEVRHALDAVIARRLARAAAPHPAGFVVLDAAALTDGGAEEGTRALARVLGAVSGGAYPPRARRLARLYEEIAADSLRGRTLSGCRVLAQGAGRLLVAREPAAMAPPQKAVPGTVVWDGRFRLRLTGAAPPRRAVRLGALGAQGWAALRRLAPDALETPAARRLPAAVRATLPALLDAAGPLSVPHIGYRRAGEGAATLRVAEIRPDVAEMLAGPRFAPAPREGAGKPAESL